MTIIFLLFARTGAEYEGKSDYAIRSRWCIYCIAQKLEEVFLEYHVTYIPQAISCTSLKHHKLSAELCLSREGMFCVLTYFAKTSEGLLSKADLSGIYRASVSGGTIPIICRSLLKRGLNSLTTWMPAGDTFYTQRVQKRFVGHLKSVDESNLLQTTEITTDDSSRNISLSCSLRNKKHGTMQFLMPNFLGISTWYHTLLEPCFIPSIHILWVSQGWGAVDIFSGSFRLVMIDEIWTLLSEANSNAPREENI